MMRTVRIAMWIVAGPLLLAVAATFATQSLSAFLLVLLSAVLGPFVGLASEAAYFTLQFKLSLAAGLFASALFVFAGVRFFEKPRGKLLILFGSICWTVAGGLGFGPQ